MVGSFPSALLPSPPLPPRVLLPPLAPNPTLPALQAPPATPLLGTPPPPLALAAPPLANILPLPPIRLAHPPFPTTLSPAICAYADDCSNLIAALPPFLDLEGASIISDVFGLASAAGLPPQSLPKTSLILQFFPLGHALPPLLDPALLSHHTLTGYRLLPVSDTSIHLGVPFSFDPLVAIHAAYDSLAPRMHGAADRWLQLDSVLPGRVHAANQCIASKAVFQCGFLPPLPPHLVAIQQAVNRLVGSTQRAEGETPFPNRLFPNKSVSMLPKSCGGLGLLDVAAAASAMIAKLLWNLFRFSPHPAHLLLRHEITSSLTPLPPLPPSHPSDFPPGAHWVVTRPLVVPLHSCSTPSFQASLDAFRQLGIKRILPPPLQDFHSVMMELTFSTPLLPTYPGIPQSSMTSVMARSWLRLSDVRAAFLLRTSLGQPAHLDLDSILGSLHPAWLHFVTLPIDPPSPWLAVTSPDAPLILFQGPDPSSGIICLWELWPGGRLHPFSGAFTLPNPNLLRPALVIYHNSPKSSWQRAQWTYHVAQLNLPPSNRRPLLEPWLVGVWDYVDLDPRVWGVSHALADSTPLLDLTVKDARRFFTKANALKRDRHSHPKIKLPGYALHGVLWPPLWPLDPPLNPSPPIASTPDALLLRRGLEGLEEFWRRTAETRSSALLTDPPSQSRLQWCDRFLTPQGVSPRAIPALTLPLPPPSFRPSYLKVWKTLSDPT